MTRFEIYKKIDNYFDIVAINHFLRVITKGGDNRDSWESYGYIKSMMIYSERFSMQELNYFIEVALDSIYR